MMKVLRSFAGDESGATAVEYGALVGFIAIAVMLVVESIGLSVQGTFLEIRAAFAGSASAQN
jgi:pilus assembly protein Flp/PilA